MTRAERIAELEAELARIKAEEEAERGLVEGENCWTAWPDGTVAQWTYYSDSGNANFPHTDDGKRKAERAGKLMSSLNFEDPPFEVGDWHFVAWPEGTIQSYQWRDFPEDHSLFHQGRIHATEAEALAWRDKFNGVWTGGGR